MAAHAVLSVHSDTARSRASSWASTSLPSAGRAPVRMATLSAITAQPTGLRERAKIGLFEIGNYSKAGEPRREVVRCLAKYAGLLAGPCDLPPQESGYSA